MNKPCDVNTEKKVNDFNMKKTQPATQFGTIPCTLIKVGVYCSESTDSSLLVCVRLGLDLRVLNPRLWTQTKDKK